MARALKHAVAPTDMAIARYGNKFAQLKAALLAHAAINTEIAVLRTLEDVERIGRLLTMLPYHYADSHSHLRNKN